MTLQHMFSNWFKVFFGKKIAHSPERQRAIDLIAAINAGGTPLNPALINNIARNLGLEVAMTAPVEATIQRIREVLAGKKP
jgi:hypothetical protein